MQRSWPVLVDLTKTDLVYPSSCVTSTRAFVKAEPKTVTAFLNTYVSAIQLIKKDQKLAERTLIKWLKEKESANLSKSVDAFVRLFKPVPYVPDKGIENILKDLALQRPCRRNFSATRSCFATTDRWRERCRSHEIGVLSLLAIIVFARLAQSKFARARRACAAFFTAPPRRRRTCRFGSPRMPASLRKPV